MKKLSLFSFVKDIILRSNVKTKELKAGQPSHEVRTEASASNKEGDQLKEHFTTNSIIWLHD